MVDWKEFEARQHEIDQQNEVMKDFRRGMLDFPASDSTELLQKPMNPVDNFGGIITRDDTTSNLPSIQDTRDVAFLLTSAVALNESRALFLMLKEPTLAGETEENRKNYKNDLENYNDSLEADKWINATVQLIKASAKSKSAVSKSYKGWLGELFITLKRKGEVLTEFVKGKSPIMK